MVNSESNTRKRAYRFALTVIRLAEKFPRNNTAKIIIHQLVRSATSIGANLVEGQSAASRKDFVNYVAIALKSANETRYWLHLAKDAELVKVDQVKPIITELEEICRMLAKTLITLRKKDGKYDL